MDRRNFLRGAAVLPLVPLATSAIAAIPVPGAVTRISVERGDPGELAYAKACGDAMVAKVFVDGVEITHAITADVCEGWVKRCVTTAKGNVAFNHTTSEIMHEVVHGRVEIAFVPRKDRDMYRKLALHPVSKREVSVPSF